MILKKLTAGIFILMIMTALVFAGGGGQSKSGAVSASGIPVLTLGIQSNSFITDYKNNYLTQYLEKFNQVSLNFYMLPTDNAETRTKLSLMVSSNDLPDLLFVNNALSPDQILDYGGKGAFITLNKYLADPAKAPHFNAIPADDRAAMLAASTSADGNIYSLPRFEPETWNFTPYRMRINQTWLEQLGLKMPATTAELREVLIAFRDRDPNGNGRKDEIGVYGQFSGGYGENVIAALLNSFIFYNIDYLSLDAAGNNVTAPFTDPAFRKGLAYLNQLYKDGVLAASIFTDNQQQFRATLNNETPIVGFTSAGSDGNWTNSNYNPNYIQMAFIPPLKGPDGAAYTPYQEYVPAQVGIITSKSRAPDLAFKFADSFYDHDISTIARFGEEGVNWSRKPEDLAKTSNAYIQMGLYPGLVLVEVESIWSQPHNKHWRNVNPRYCSLEAGNLFGNLAAPYDGSGNLPGSKNQAYNYEYYIGKYPSRILPQLKYTADESLKIAEPMATINEYVRQTIAEFATGLRDINNDTQWNAYLRELDNMGLKQWLTNAQTAYNRQRR